MRFRWSLGALLPKQAKLGRADASGKLQSLSRSTKLELMKVGDHIWPWWPLQQWYPVPCLTLTCQKVLSAFIFVGMGQMGECPKEIVFAPQIIMRITMMVVVDWALLYGCARFFPDSEGSRSKGQMKADSILYYASYTVYPAWAASLTGRSTFCQLAQSAPKMARSAPCIISEGVNFSNPHKNALWISGGPTILSLATL